MCLALCSANRRRRPHSRSLTVTGYEPSDLWEEGEQSQSSDFFGLHALVENDDDDEDDSGGAYTALNRYRPSGTPAASPLKQFIDADHVCVTIDVAGQKMRDGKIQPGVRGAVK
jgi:hypothetical protein